MMGFLRSAMVVARRDFTASVWSRSFLFFLLGPLVILGVSALFGGVSQNLAKEDIRVTIGVIAEEADFQALHAARERIAKGTGGPTLPELLHVEPGPDPSAQIQSLLASSEKRVVAVMSGGLDHPRITGPISRGNPLQHQIGLIVEEARQKRALAAAGVTLQEPAIEIAHAPRSAGVVATTRAMIARAGQLILFMLTVLLAGMLLSNMLEEKSNKVIEILAAAIPINAIFLGKIFAMLAVSLVGIAVWTSGGLAVLAAQPNWAAALPQPAVGWPLFLLLVLLYYSANYLLLGALFLGIGSQAASVREVQTLSMPVTVGQMLIFLFASLAVTPPNGAIGITAAVFPFSSPLAMISRAAQMPELWTHAAALLWQAVWVWLTISFGAALFRRNVLKSGSGGFSFKRLRRRA